MDKHIRFRNMLGCDDAASLTMGVLGQLDLSESTLSQYDRFSRDIGASLVSFDRGCMLSFLKFPKFLGLEKVS
jgi:hypothetical protein